MQPYSIAASRLRARVVSVGVSLTAAWAARVVFSLVICLLALQAFTAPTHALSAAPRSLTFLLGSKADNTLVVWGRVKSVTPVQGHVLSEIDYSASAGAVLRGKVAGRSERGAEPLLVRENVGAFRSEGELSRGDEVVLFLRPVSLSPGSSTGAYEIVAGGSGLFRVRTSRCGSDQLARSACPKTIVNLVNNQELFRGETLWQLFLNPPDADHPAISDIAVSFRTKLKGWSFTSDEQTRILDAAVRPPDGGIPLELLRAVLLYLNHSSSPPV